VISSSKEETRSLADEGPLKNGDAAPIALRSWNSWREATAQPPLTSPTTAEADGPVVLTERIDVLKPVVAEHRG
jgi:hypothetical protein